MRLPSPRDDGQTREAMWHPARLLPAALAALLVAGLGAPTPVGAQAPPWTVVASGLDNPRGLAFAHRTPLPAARTAHCTWAS
jgi:hypothetical protein